MSPEDYVNSVTGKPWAVRGDGPAEFDCFGLVMDSYRKIDGVHLEKVQGYEDAGNDTGDLATVEIGTGRWRQSHPHDGAVMVVLCEINGKPRHFGRCILGGVLHAHGKLGEGGQVRWNDYRTINRLFRDVTYYALDPTS